MRLFIMLATLLAMTEANAGGHWPEYKGLYPGMPLETAKALGFNCNPSDKSLSFISDYTCKIPHTVTTFDSIGGERVTDVQAVAKNGAITLITIKATSEKGPALAKAMASKFGPVTKTNGNSSKIYTWDRGKAEFISLSLGNDGYYSIILAIDPTYQTPAESAAEKKRKLAVERKAAQDF